MIRVDIINDKTGTEKVGNYVYRVYTPFKTLIEGKVVGHLRDDGWVILLDKLIDSIYEAKKLSTKREKKVV